MIRPLSIVWNFDPVLFSIGSLDIRYYGLMWVLAIFVGAKLFDCFCKRDFVRHVRNGIVRAREKAGLS